MQQNRPIFVVGSPRSGTSVLTWCLGQHSNIFLQEESSWIGPFAYQIELAYRVGTARGARSQLSALDVEREEFFTRFGETINRLILDHRVGFEAKGLARVLENRERSSPEVNPLFRISRSAEDPKGRWVDGTPEYSFYVHPLGQLFPEARFIHIVRDATDVVRSMMHFQNTGGPALVEDLRQAYRLWFTATRACREAELAFGSEMVRRVRYADLIARPKEVLAELLAFVGEEFEQTCLDPLRIRINSSKVPADFEAIDLEADPAVANNARAFSAEMMRDPEPAAPDPEAAARMGEFFHERADYLARALS